MAAFKTLGETEWGADISPLAVSLASRTRERTLQTISQAYSSISVADVSLLLGLTEPEATQGRKRLCERLHLMPFLFASMREIRLDH